MPNSAPRDPGANSIEADPSRSVIRTGGLAACGPAAVRHPGSATPRCGANRAQPTRPGWQHGLSLFGELKYPAGFKHFDYVNPRTRPKGGTVRLIAFGTFDNFNLVVAGREGLARGGST